MSGNLWLTGTTASGVKRGGGLEPSQAVATASVTRRFVPLWLYGSDLVKLCSDIKYNSLHVK